MTTRHRNRYCSICLRTKKFWTVGEVEICETCRKRLHVVKD